MEQQTQLRLKVGGNYRDTNGAFVVIVDKKKVAAAYPFIDCDGYLWSESGKRPDKTQAHLVSECE